MKDYIIGEAGWHTQRPRKYEFDNTQIYKYLPSLIDYLVANGLLNNSILSADQRVTDDTQIKAFNLTKEGFEFIRLFTENQGSSIQYRTSGYVASSISTSALVEWVDGFWEGYICKIRTPSNAIDINAIYGKTYEFSWENEIVVPLRIPYRNIMSYKFVKSE